MMGWVSVLNQLFEYELAFEMDPHRRMFVINIKSDNGKKYFNLSI